VTRESLVSTSQPSLTISVHGPGATIDDVIEAGEETKRLLEAIASTMGIPDGAVKWVVQSAEFRCDGCDLRRPDRPSSDEGWTHVDGDDFCPTCSEALPS